MCFQHRYSVFSDEGIYLLVKEGISAPSLQNLARLLPWSSPRIRADEWRGQGCIHWEGASHSSCVCRVSQFQCLRGAPPPPGHSPQALRQSPTETSWSDGLGTFQLSSSGWDPQQCCRLKKKKTCKVLVRKLSWETMSTKKSAGISPS